MKENKLMKRLVGLSANPSGFSGRMMTKIWSKYFVSLSNWTVDSITISEGSNILEVGYGGGSTIKKLASLHKNLNIYGIDISQASYEQTIKVNKKAIEEGNVHISIGDVSAMEFQDEMFDGIFVVQNHMYWDDLEKGLEECLRVLKPGGVLVISSELNKIKYHLNEYYDSFDFNKLLVMKGYSMVKSNKDNTHIIYWCKK